MPFGWKLAEEVVPELLGVFDEKSDEDYPANQVNAAFVDRHAGI